MPRDHPEISVVIGSQQARQTIGPCLKTVIAQAHRLKAEVIVADGSTDGTADIVASQFPDVTLIRSDPRQLIPHLWGQAIVRARAPLIAITTAHCIPADDWLHSIVRDATAYQQYAGIGGPIDGPADGYLMDWAMYFSRYAAYMPPVLGEPVAEIPGDNAVYRRAALECCWDERAHGFWETLVHHRLRAAGENLYMSPNIRVRLGRTAGAWSFVKSRFRHGRHFGSTRPATSPVGRVARVLTAPTLMPFLLFRIGKRVASHRRDWWRTYLLALPWLVLFLGAWSLGEISGYLAPQGSTA